ncbi:MAG: hypothetical protein SV377_03285 [Halobacteria archaeon]|nr:hypothetical protein [Halobacteria archaeon]
MTISNGNLSDELNDTSNVLLLSPSITNHGDGVCNDLLTVTDPGRENVMWITFTHSPDQRMDAWREHVDEGPARSRFISVGDITRSATSRSTPSADGGNFAVETVRQAGNLTSLGVSITKSLSELNEDDNKTVVCFHSLTALLQYFNLKDTFQFLHVLVSHFKDKGAFAHFHLDPTACDEQTMATITSLFDAVVEVDEEGSTNVLKA